MSNQTKQWGAIIVMIALFAMIAFVTNLCSPMANIIKAQGDIPEVLAQIGNYGNFIAYLVMGIPAGMLIAKFGYKKTALIGLATGIAGILIQWVSGMFDAKENIALVFGIYLAGAFIAGLCMCILNCVVNPMLNILGGGGNSGNQLIQTGGVFNSSAAVAVYIIMGALIGEISKDTAISDATPALMIALGIFVVAFIVILFTKIEEPEQAPVDVNLIKGAMKYRHFVLGIIAIFLYMGIEVGVPTYVNMYLVEIGISAATAGLIVALYWLMMLVGRFIGSIIGGKVSSRAMITTVSIVTLVLVAFGMFASPENTVEVPGIDWGKLSIIWAEVPVGIFAFLLVGLCTSVMWGGIFNMAVEGLGKYTAVASGIFMTMVFGCAVMLAIQAQLAEMTDYMTSYWVVMFCAAYLLFYALIGSKPAKK